MLTTQKCGQCGAEFDAHGTAAACPACLMELGLHRGELPEEGDPIESAEAQEARRFQPPKPGELASRFPQLEILDLIGHGGMGAVYVAEQQAPVRRRVALKIIKWGMDTERTGPIAIKNAKGKFADGPIYNTAIEYTFDCVYANGVMIGHGASEFGLDFLTSFFPQSAVSARVFDGGGGEQNRGGLRPYST